MSGETEDAGKQTCRLCAGEHEATITLFSQQSEDMLLQEKLSKYLLIELVEYDNLPKNICIECCTKLLSLCTFVEDVRQAQLSLYRQISIYNRDHEKDTVDKTDENIVLINGDDFTDPATLKAIIDDNNQPKLQILNEDPKPPRTKSFNCEICKRGFVTDLALRSHIWTHKIRKRKIMEMAEKYNETEIAEYKEIYDCDHCSRKFRTQRTYDDHMTMHSNTPNIHTCKVCGRAYRSYASLKAHNLTHSDVKPHTCHLCPKRFKRKLELQVHINQHTGKRPYKCPHCDRTFASASNCHTHRIRMHPGKVHINHHTGRRPYECPHCDLSFSSASNCHAHRRRKHPGKGAARKPGKSKHKNKGEVEIEAETIEVKSNLVNDRGLFKYQCQQCTHRFSTRENYMCHMYQHTGKKMNKCSLCPAEFITRKGLALHCLKLHPIKKQSEVFFMSKNVLFA